MGCAKRLDCGGPALFVDVYIDDESSAGYRAKIESTGFRAYGARLTGGGEYQIGEVQARS